MDYGHLVAEPVCPPDASQPSIHGRTNPDRMNKVAKPQPLNKNHDRDLLILQLGY
jgi:hypothetical protein